MDVEDRDQAGFYGGAFSGPFFVATSDRGRSVPVVKGVAGTVVHGHVADVIGRAREAADGRDVGVLGTAVARACMDAGLLDEIVVFLAPILLGSGVRLHSGPMRRLDLVRTRRDGELVTLTFAPRPAVD